MFAALASAALIVAGSLAVGHAVLVLCGRREPTALAGPIGLALLLAAAAITALLEGRGTAIAVVLGALLAAGLVLVARAPERLAGAGAPAAAAGLAALFAALPFIASWSFGILGVGLVNDDMASHLLISDWIEERFRPEPVFIDQGYPLGPHGLVAGLASALHADSIDVFAGLTLAIPALTALVAFSALVALNTLPRILCSALVALPYMAAAYLAQEAFKEPILALFLLTFALLLPTVRTPRDAIPLGLLAAGAVYVYSFPGLAWLIATAAIWIAIEHVLRRTRDGSEGGGGRRQRLRSMDARTPADMDVKPPLTGASPTLAPRTLRPILASRSGLTGIALAALAFAVLIAPELPRLIDFKDFRALDPDRANDGGLGNLHQQLSPLTALGIWPTSSFRLGAGEGSLPAALFYLGALVGAGALALALPRWVRRHGWAIPAALASAALLYVAARAFGTVYTSAKALSIIAPLVTLTTLGGLLADGRRIGRMRVGTGALALVVALAGAFSSFLVLRQAHVAPEAHMRELAEIRPLVEGRKLLFLGRDNFVLYELRGSRPFVATKNYYVPASLYAEPNTELASIFSKFDFDSVTAETLSEFEYVLTTRAAYASGPPRGAAIAAKTPNYVLWRLGAPDLERIPAEPGAEPGAVSHCERPGSDSPELAGAAFAAEPVTAPASGWSRDVLESGESASTVLSLRPGRWEISAAYDSTRRVELTAAVGGAEPAELATLPGNLDYRGPAPYWPAGVIEIEPADREVDVEITATVGDPPLAGRLLGAKASAHMGPVAATRARSTSRPTPAPLPGGAGRFVSGAEICGQYMDWFRARAGERP